MSKPESKIPSWEEVARNLPLPIDRYDEFGDPNPPRDFNYDPDLDDPTLDDEGGDDDDYDDE